MSKAKRDYLVATPITMSVHKRGEDPNGEDAILVSVEYGEDDTAVVRIMPRASDTGELVCTLEELCAVRQAAIVLVAQWNDNSEIRK